MIYLIQSAAYNLDGSFIHILKIGYTEDSKFRNRFAAYKTHNPTCRVLYKIPECGELDEITLHQYFEKFKKYGKEWYEYNEEIIQFFKTHTTCKSIKSKAELEFEAVENKIAQLKEEISLLETKHSRLSRLLIGIIR